MGYRLPGAGRTRRRRDGISMLFCPIAKIAALLDRLTVPIQKHGDRSVARADHDGEAARLRHGHGARRDPRDQQETERHDPLDQCP